MSMVLPAVRRFDKRKEWAIPTRIQALEDDEDLRDVGHAEVVNELRAVRDELKSAKRSLYSFSGSMILVLLAAIANLVVK